MPITRAQLAKELEPGLNALFGLEYDRYDQDITSSPQKIEETVSFSVVVWLDRGLKDVRVEAYPCGPGGNEPMVVMESGPSTFLAIYRWKGRWPQCSISAPISR